MNRANVDPLPFEKATRSGVWNHFRRGMKSATCLLCDRTLVYNGGTTSNLLSHLQRKHPSKVGPVVVKQEPGLPLPSVAAPAAAQAFLTIPATVHKAMFISCTTRDNEDSVSLALARHEADLHCSRPGPEGAAPLPGAKLHHSFDDACHVAHQEELCGWERGVVGAFAPSRLAGAHFRYLDFEGNTSVRNHHGTLRRQRAEPCLVCPGDYPHSRQPYRHPHL